MNMQYFNPVRSLVSAIGTAATKAFQFGRASFNNWLFVTGRSRIDYAKYVGDGSGNSAVMAAVLFIARAFPEAPLMIGRLNRDNEYQPVYNHPMLKLINKPNRFYSGVVLFMATLIDFMLDGNAYWFKVRSLAGNVVELWHIPYSLVEPFWEEDSRNFIDYYEYNPGGLAKPYKIRVEDVVHFRFGLDRFNIRKGYAPLKSVLRAVFTDDEAANFTAALVSNLGIPGLVITPEEDVELDEAGANSIKQEFINKFSGDKRGEPLILHSKAKVTTLSFNPQQLELRGTHKWAEERITGVLGVAAIVCGLGAGLDRSTFANFEEAKESVYESNIIPMQRLWAADIYNQLLPDFDNPDRVRVYFDLSGVRILQEDENERIKRIDTQVRGGWMKVSRAKELTGELVEPGDDIYLRSIGTVEVGPDAALNMRADSEPEPEPSSGAEDAAIPGDDTEKSIQLKKRFNRGSRRILSALEKTLGRNITLMQSDVTNEFTRIADAIIDALILQKSKPLVTVGSNGHSKVDILPSEIEADMAVDAALTTHKFTEIYSIAYQRISEASYQVISDSINTPISFSVDDPDIAAFVRTSAYRVSLLDLSRAVNRAVKRAIRDGTAEGENLEQLTGRIRSYVRGRELYPGVYDLAYTNARVRGYNADDAAKLADRAAADYRARLIALTELRTAQNLAAVSASRKSGTIRDMLVYDGDDCGWSGHDDPEKANGKVVSFDDAKRYPLAHPRCVRTFLPNTG